MNNPFTITVQYRDNMTRDFVDDDPVIIHINGPCMADDPREIEDFLSADRLYYLRSGYGTYTFQVEHIGSRDMPHDWHLTQIGFTAA